jgi:hypothetical protein
MTLEGDEYGDELHIIVSLKCTPLYFVTRYRVASLVTRIASLDVEIDLSIRLPMDCYTNTEPP